MKEVSPSGESVDASASAEVLIPKGNSPPFPVQIIGFGEDVKYRLQLIFAPSGQDVQDWLKEPKGKTKDELFAKVLKKYKDSVTETRKRMARQAAVQVMVNP